MLRMIVTLRSATITPSVGRRSAAGSPGTWAGEVAIPVVLPESYRMGMRMLILSASVEAGHLRGAEAVEKFPDAEVKNVDALALTNGAPALGRA